MRNLLGRLHGRPDADLARIAEFWGVPRAPTRQSLIAALFRALSDPRAARDVWDRLQPDERAAVRELALAERDAGTPTLAELASRLGVGEEAARETATRLYRAGILAREGDDEPLPVGEAPRLFLPREIGSLFRRVQDEIEAGDLSGTPLRALLELLDDAEVEAAAAAWGFPVVPGLRGRAEIGRRLLRQLGEPARVEKLVAARRRDAANLWRSVRDEPGGEPVPLARAAAAAGLDGDDPRTVERRRAALDELETTLLLWHTYRADGERWLFVPAEIRAPAPPPAAPLPPLEPVIAPTLEPPRWHHPDALAWDLLTLLRELNDGRAAGQPWVLGDLPRARLRRLNRRFWHGRDGEEAPPAGYVDLLLALGQSEGLIEEDAGHGEGDKPRWTLGPSARGWRERPFPAQSERLRWWWLASADWIEGRARAEVEVWGADWRGARRRLLALLVEPDVGLEPGTWYALDSVAARLAARDPELLGTTFTAATARAAGEAGAAGSEEDARLAAITEVVRVELETAFAWFGLVELAAVPGQTRAVRRGDRLDGDRDDAEPPPDMAAGEGSGPALVVRPDGGIELLAATPLRVWALAAFAEPEALGPTSRYRLSAGSMARALAAGFDLDQVTTFLERQAGRPLPPPLAEALAGWARGYRRVRVRPAVVVAPDDPQTLPEIARLLTERNFAVRELGDGRLLVETAGAEGDPEAAVMTRLREGGYAPNRRPAGPAGPGGAARRGEDRRAR